MFNVVPATEASTISFVSVHIGREDRTTPSMLQMVSLIEAVIEFKSLLFKLEQNNKQWRAFHSLPSQSFSK